MVDELELLRKDWQKQEQSLPHFSKEELYPMLLKKSSSLVRWILIVSVLEFGFWIVLTFGVQMSNDQTAAVENAIGNTTELTFTALHLAALVFFLGWFFKNYKKIQNTDSPSILMKNIINTRKTVKYYIYFNLIFFVVATIGAFILLERNTQVPIQASNLGVSIASLILILGFSVGILIIFYKLLYGRLLKRLKANYDELKKLEI